MRNLRKALALIIIIVAAFALAACGSSGGGGGGGNGGGGGLTYSGESTPADLSNSTTAEAFASGTMGAMDNVGGPMGALSAEKTKDGGVSVLRTIMRLTRNAAKQISSGGSSLSAEATQTDSGSEPGPCGNGTMSYFMTLNDVTGTFSATFTYRNFDDCSSVTNGSMSMSGIMDLYTYEPISMTLSFRSLTMTDKASGESVTMDGSISMGTSGSAMTMTLNLLFKDSTDGKVYWMNNWTATATDYGSYETIDFSGRFYHPDHGYVDFETTTSLTIYTSDANPTTGVVVYTGANNTKAKVDFNTGSLSTAYLSLDTDGDGGYDWGPAEFTL